MTRSAAAASAPTRSVVQLILHSPSRMAALAVALSLVLNVPGTIAQAIDATQAELAVLVVVAPVTFVMGLYFIYRLWRRPTRTIIAVFLVIWIAPVLATIVGGGLQPGAILPLGLDIGAALLAAFALSEPRTLQAAQPSR